MLSKSYIKPSTLIAICIAIFAVMILRRPDIITNAQPWAEDGKIWLAGIYNEGFWASLVLPQNGYYQTISRLTYGISLLFGISNAALASNVIAVLIRVAFCAFILSKRMSFAPLKYRLVAVAYMVLMPNLEEGYVNITNIHWYLSMYLMAVVMADNAESASWKLHDYSLLIISSLSGPFVVFIAPCLLIKRVYERGGLFNAIKGINSFDAIMALCSIIQVAAILLSPDTARSSAPLGASIGMLVKIVAYRIMSGTFFPNEAIDFMPYNKWLCAGIFVIFAAPIMYFIVRGGWRYKVAFLFPALMFGFALAKPMMSITEPQWPVFFGPGNGERYFFVTNFVFFCFVLYLVSKTGAAGKYVLPAVAVVTVCTVISDFRIKPMPEVGFKEDMVRFNSMRRGEKMDLRINPPGWTMELKKN